MLFEQCFGEWFWLLTATNKRTKLQLLLLIILWKIFMKHITSFDKRKIFFLQMHFIHLERKTRGVRWIKMIFYPVRWHIQCIRQNIQRRFILKFFLTVESNDTWQTCFKIQENGRHLQIISLRSIIYLNIYTNKKKSTNKIFVSFNLKLWKNIKL